MGDAILGVGGDIYGPSQDLWKGVGLAEIFRGNRDKGWGIRDDFKNFGTAAAPSSNLAYYTSEGNLYKTFEGSSTQTVVPGDSVWSVPSAFNVYSPNGQAQIIPAGYKVPTPGVIALTPQSGSVQAQIQLAPNGAAGACGGAFTPYPISSSVQGDVIFEVRLALSALTHGITSFFAGLGGTNVVATSVPVADGSYSGTPSLLGFGALYGDGTAGSGAAGDGAIGMVWNKAGGTPQGQGAGLTALNLMRMGGAGSNTPTSTYPTFPNVQVGGAGGIPSLLPSTYIGWFVKLGFRYSPASGIFTPYINGVAQDGHAGPDRRVSSSGIQGSTAYGYPGDGTYWPADLMTFTAGLYHHTGSVYQTLYIDWYQCVQLVN